MKKNRAQKKTSRWAVLSQEIQDIKNLCGYKPKAAQLLTALSPFEAAFGKEKADAERAALAVIRQRRLERQAADLLAWAKEKGMVPQHATKLPDDAEQARAIAYLYGGLQGATPAS